MDDVISLKPHCLEDREYRPIGQVNQIKVPRYHARCQDNLGN